MSVTNSAIDNPRTWEEDGLKFTELICQEYSGNNAVISGGYVEGHLVDTVYLRFERDNDEPVTITLRPDELATVAWCASGVMFSWHIDNLEKI